MFDLNQLERAREIVADAMPPTPAPRNSARSTYSSAPASSKPVAKPSSVPAANSPACSGQYAAQTPSSLSAAVDSTDALKTTGENAERLDLHFYVAHPRCGPFVGRPVASGRPLDGGKEFILGGSASASRHFQTRRLARNLLDQILVGLLVQALYCGELGLGLRRASQALIDLRQAVACVGSRGIQPHGLAEFPCGGLVLFAAGMEDAQIQVDDANPGIQAAGFFQQRPRAFRIVAMQEHVAEVSARSE